MLGNGVAAEKLQDFFAEMDAESLGRFVADIEHLRDSDPLAAIVIDEARKFARATGIKLERAPTVMRAMFTPLDPFIVAHGQQQKQPARINRETLSSIWTWLERDIIGDKLSSYHEAISLCLNRDEETIAGLLREARIIIADAIFDMAEQVQHDQSIRHRINAQIGNNHGYEDALDIATVFRYEDELATLSDRLPKRFTRFTREDVSWCIDKLDGFWQEHSHLLHFGLALIMARLAYPVEIVRIPMQCIGGDDIDAVRSHRYGAAVDLAVYDIGISVSEVETNLSRERDIHLLRRQLLSYTSLVRGLRLALALGGKSPAMVGITRHCANMSTLLGNELRTIPGDLKACLTVAATGESPIFEMKQAEFELLLYQTCRAMMRELALNDLMTQLRRDIEQLLTAASSSVIGKLRNEDPIIRNKARKHFDVLNKLTALGLGDEAAVKLRRLAGLPTATEAADKRGTTPPKRAIK